MTGGRIMALDVGDRRIGIALSDPEGLLAFAHSILQRKGREKDTAAIQQLADESEVAVIIVGLPLSLDGGDSQQTERVRRFAVDLSARIRQSVVLRDERLSTVAAQRAQREAGHSSISGRTSLDAWAAAHILQGYLDELRMRQSE